VVLLAALVAGIAMMAGGGNGGDHAADLAAEGTTTTAAVTSFPPPPAIEVPPGGFTAEQIAVHFGDAVWRVEASGCGVETSGSGFAISPRHVVTNWHVVVGDTEPELVSRNGERIPGHVVGMTKSPDVALIVVDQPLSSYLAWADTATLVEGQPLVALGYPRPLRTFTVTELSIMSFDRSGERRIGMSVDGRIDRGNSGGPSLTTDGKVAGINTAVNINQGAALGALSGGGFQVVPYLETYEGVKASLDSFLADSSGKTVPPDCAKLDPRKAKSYGDNAQLDELWELCDAGNSFACDLLVQASAPDSDYYQFGVTCGARMPVAGYCLARWGPQLPPRD
jgi:S1-C subfamily serine protease